MVKQCFFAVFFCMMMMLNASSEKINSKSKKSFESSSQSIMAELDDGSLLEFVVAITVLNKLTDERGCRNMTDGMDAKQVIDLALELGRPAVENELKLLGAMSDEERLQIISTIRRSISEAQTARKEQTTKKEQEKTEKKEQEKEQARSRAQAQAKREMQEQAQDDPAVQTKRTPKEALGMKRRPRGKSQTQNNSLRIKSDDESELAFSLASISKSLPDGELLEFLVAAKLLHGELGREKYLEFVDEKSVADVVLLAREKYPAKFLEELNHFSPHLEEMAAACRLTINMQALETPEFWLSAIKSIEILSDEAFVEFIAAAAVFNAEDIEHSAGLLVDLTVSELVQKAKLADEGLFQSRKSTFISLISTGTSMHEVRKKTMKQLNEIKRRY